MDLESRIAKLTLWDAAYAADAPLVSDAVYDALWDETKALAPDHPYFKTVGAKAQSAWEKIRLGYPMGSLNKVQTDEEMRAWLPNEPIFGTLKLDGISVLLRYEAGRLVWAATRGDGQVGEAITQNVRKMMGVPEYVLVGTRAFTGFVRGEIILRKSVFETHFRPWGYKNCRNAAGGAAKDLSGERCHLLTVMCYEIRPDDVPLRNKVREFNALMEGGFSTPPWLLSIRSADEIKSFYDDYVRELRAALDYDIDGLVLYVNDTDVREAMGETDHRPEGARAFKFPHETAETTLRDIVWQVGASGRITPVAYFDAVVLGGREITRASLATVHQVLDMKLSRGCRIMVSSRNDVIPRVEANLDEGIINS